MSQEPPKPDTFYALPEELHNELWARIEKRLGSGDVLITTQQFKEALEEEYRGITGEPPSEDLKNLFDHAVDSFNEENPDLYLTQGVQNGVIQAFYSGVERLEWDTERIEDRGPRIIENFKGREPIRTFLSSLRVAPERIDPQTCVRGVIAQIETAKAPPEPPTPAPVPARPVTLSDETANALQDGDIDRRQVDERIAAEDQAHRRIERNEIQRVPRRVYRFVEQGTLSQEEGGQIVELHRIDQQVTRGELSREEGGRARARLMDRQTRTRLNDKLKGVVDYAVRYLHVFEALKRLPAAYDDALRFLIRHKGLCGPQADRRMLGDAMTELTSDDALLDALADIMDRRDHEIRMIAVSLPPYGEVGRKGREPIANMPIGEGFIDELRAVEPEAMSERLNDPGTRGADAASMQCLIALVASVIKPTPLRKEIRLLKIQRVLEEFFYESSDMGAARSQATDLIKRRLRHMYPDFSVDERGALQERTDAMLDTAEEKVLTERKAGGEARTGSPTRALDGDEMGLSPAEEECGALLGRVQFRIPGGGMRNVRHRIMPDPDDPERDIIVHRDPESGALVPLLRNGVRRYVRQERNGLWKVVSGP